jgi:6,7-dimethyl-8-ribityllumazine synthase
MDLNLKYNKPFIFGVLTTENQQQATDRAGGRLGNKGDEAAVTAIKMVDLFKRFAEKQ